MSLNTTPIFIGTPKVQWALVSASNASSDANIKGTGTLGTDVMTIFSASANGSRVDSITIQPLGTNVQTVISIFINNGSDNTNSANNSSIYAVSMNSTAASTNTSLNKTDLIFANGINLPVNYRLLASTFTTVAAGFHITAFGGDY